MTLDKTNSHSTDGMRYVPTGRATPTSEQHGKIARKALKNLVNSQNTFYTLWCIVVKHKIPLLVTGNIILVLNWAFPEWFQLVKAIFVR